MNEDDIQLVASLSFTVHDPDTRNRMGMLAIYADSRPTLHLVWTPTGDINAEPAIRATRQLSAYVTPYEITQALLEAGLFEENR